MTCSRVESTTRPIATMPFFAIASRITPNAFVGYHVAVPLALGGGLVTSVIAAAAGAAVVLFAWRLRNTAPAGLRPARPSGRIWSAAELLNRQIADLLALGATR
jgi:hypothetical protein